MPSSLAVDPGSSFADPVTWINFGALGLVVIGLITGWLWTKPSVDRLTAERDRALADREKAEAQRDAMAQVLQDKLLPVVGDFVTTTRAFMPMLQELQQLQRSLPLMYELIRQQGDFRDKPAPPRGRKRPPDRAGD